MKLQHLSKTIDIEPKQAAVETRIVLMLNKHRSGARQNKLFQLTNSGRAGIGWLVFDAAVERLIEEAVIVRSATNQEHSFLLKLTPFGEQQANELEDALSTQKGVVA